MDKDYSKIPSRLLAYRKAMDQTQESMSRQFGVTQSHYCKIEAGNKIMSFQSLKKFAEYGGDIFYLLTGEKQIHGQIDVYISRCKTGRGRTELYKMILWALQQGIHLNNAEIKGISDKAYKSLRLAEIELEESAIWKNIRKLEDISQIDMASKLDINIKRYRRIEKMEVKPDAEILSTVYITFGYSPMVFFDSESFYTSEANEIWNGFTEEVRGELSEILENAIQLINKYEEK